jgi:hypothetical protein
MDPIMNRITWRDGCKFLSGVMFAGSLMNLYLYMCRTLIPLMNHQITDEYLGTKLAVQFTLFVVFFYLGYRDSILRTTKRT